MSVDQRALFNELLTIAKRDRARRSRWRKVGKVIGALVEALLTGFLASLLGGWMLMLAAGVAHDHWIPQLPTIGYWWAVLIYFLLPSATSSSSKKKSAS